MTSHLSTNTEVYYLDNLIEQCPQQDCQRPCIPHLHDWGWILHCMVVGYTECKPQYSYWKYAENIVNFCRLYLQYFHSGNILEILWKHWKYSKYKYRGNFIIILRYSQWKHSRYNLQIFTVFPAYFQWLYCGSHPVIDW